MGFLDNGSHHTWSATYSYQKDQRSFRSPNQGWAKMEILGRPMPTGRPPLIDFLCKRIFGDGKNTQILIHFLNGVHFIRTGGW